MSTQTAAEGLAGVVIAQTETSKVNGEIGRLVYAGYDIEDLAEHATYEEVLYLLWNTELPTVEELEAFNEALYRNRVLAPEIIAMLKTFPADGHPMAVLRSVTSTLALYDDESEDNSPEATYRKARRLVAKMPTVVAAWERIRNGEEPLDPRDDLGMAANFLYMMHGEEATPAEIDAIDAYLVLLADHGLNASTFSSRVTTSTLADLHSAITTAIGTLKGSAHGGANQRAMEQFMDVGEVENVDGWFENAMESGQRIMGIGHRVYKAPDPRGKILKKRAQAIAESDESQSKWFEIAHQLEEKTLNHEFFTERSLYANVDYYSAIVLRSVGIPTDQFTCLFAMSRVGGWCAHVIEQWENNRLIRPRAEYVGPMDLDWVDIGDRE